MRHRVKFHAIGQTVDEICRFSRLFSKWRPSVTLDLFCACLDYPRISIQLCLSLCKIWLELMQYFRSYKFQYFTSLAWKCLLTPLKWVLGDLTTLKGGQLSLTATLKRYTSSREHAYKSLRSVHPFLHSSLTLLPNTPNPTLYNASQSATSASSMVEYAAPWFSEPTRLNILNGRFWRAHNRIRQL